MVMVKEKVVEIRWWVVEVVLVFEEDVLRLICGYALQSGSSLQGKQSLHDYLRGEGGEECDTHTWRK